MTFIHDFRATALADGIKPETYDRSMAGITRNPRVEQANSSSPNREARLGVSRHGRVRQRIAKGAALLAANAAMLGKIENRFGVQREYLVAIWGVESNYGTEMGHFNMFEALATLAFEGPRMDYGQRELIAALKMEEREISIRRK